MKVGFVIPLLAASYFGMQGVHAQRPLPLEEMYAKAEYCAVSQGFDTTGNTFVVDTTAVINRRPSNIIAQKQPRALLVYYKSLPPHIRKNTINRHERDEDVFSINYQDLSVRIEELYKNRMDADDRARSLAEKD